MDKNKSIWGVVVLIIGILLAIFKTGGDQLVWLWWVVAVIGLILLIWGYTKKS